MLVVLTVLATALTVLWVIFLFSVGEDDWKIAAVNQVLHNLDEMEKLNRKSIQNKEKLSACKGFSLRVMKLFYEVDVSKQLAKLNADNEQLQAGNLKNVSILVMPGYAIQRRFPSLVQGTLFKNMLQNYTELKGRKYAMQRTKGLLAALLSYPIIGLAAALSAIVIFSLLFGIQMGAFVGGMIALLVVVLVYAQYDEVTDQLNKRRRAISRQFPNVVSKLALLTTSGMIVNKAWKETAYSQGAELYLEMQKTSEELDNLVRPEDAYTNFINRCNTKETTKLASAIMQNLSKGNAEIGHLLKELAAEAWIERQHTARKDGEKANSMLMVPTMLLFISILIMIIAPVMASLSF